ncbi:MAG: porin family protein [Phyllobacteriaceae bacterium]|nr:porin family protein [Phyllobacteriaceae bacterium]
MTQFLRLLAGAALLASPAAFAADYDPPIVIDEAPEYQPVEIGSGWYLRGDVGYTLNHLPTFDITASTQTQTSSILSASIGAGYYFNDWLRVDGDLNFLNSDQFADSYNSTCAGTQITTVTDTVSGLLIGLSSAASTRDCDGADVASNVQSTGLVNAYADLGTFAGFTPYVGAGAGLALTNYRMATNDRMCSAEQTSIVAGGNTITTSFLCNGQSSVTDDDIRYPGVENSQTQVGLAYALNAGVAYKVSKNTQIDLGYRFTSLPSATYAAHNAGGLFTATGLNFHQVRLGLRYQIW